MKVKYMELIPQLHDLLREIKSVVQMLPHEPEQIVKGHGSSSDKVH